ncbi:hypothetical protein H4R21_002670 [Coemansia helicoidea]|uniref:Uncharacterized protein n=1 Tax=Coemansia helicoidea TaxID=1286919 RepID=A0ACC1L5P8_9FUNG|nr:hypothetical protein H4R21_002670 [Coemansia helicoidea]
MSFIVWLPVLETLEFAEIRMGKLPADMTITPLKKHEPLEPLDSNLQTLSLAFRDKSKVNVRVAAAKYLLMRLPNLTTLSAVGFSAKPLLDFARDYSRFYPHLENAESVFRSQRQR